MLLRVGVGLALYGAALAGAYVSRDSAGGRAIPTTGGALAGAILGVIPALVIDLASAGKPIENERNADNHAVLWAVGALVGGTAGGYLAWRLSGDADARVAATAITWALPCVFAARLSF
jgi:drug/metabolite transporter (DMT)-like permease